MLIPSIQAAAVVMPMLKFPVIVVGVRNGEPYTLGKSCCKHCFSEFSCMVLEDNPKSHLIVTSMIGGDPMKLMIGRQENGN